MIESLNQCTVTLTRQCNLRCSFCYAKETDYLPQDIIEYTNLLKIIDFCDDAKVKYIVFTGGEPTLYPQLINVLKYIKNKKNIASATIATNGIRLSDCDYCKELVYNGISYIDISLKGNTREACLKSVGSDCFMQQTKAIQNLASLPVNFTCSMVVTSENVNSICDVLANSMANGAKQFSFTFVIDNEFSSYTDIAYLINKNPLKLIEDFTNQIDRLNSITEDWWIEYSFPMCFYSESQLDKLKGKLASPCHVHSENGITFDTDMNLIPCNMFFENKIGKLGIDFSSYKEFLEYAKNSKYSETSGKLRQIPSTNCSSCIHLESCYGGCPVTWKNYSYDAFSTFKIR